ncbi:hypothetical protein KZ483_25685 [Paenibacillus sp. sptzw28]|uniref:hypothetical protein n=1 Tax=Paenibacillus sp. sptzw28 TaxID=715179 RepID=UPI001C6E00E2|nr:hypothetical protein [Paenibacillus sp. sptzw28]QYR21070.1 hypothetical protein KZ483_25685 [Paenibacillus sp. sptzw28]
MGDKLMPHHKKPMLIKQKYLGFLLIALGIVIILIKASSDRSDEGPTLFYIGGTGEQVGQFPVKDGLVYYSVTFDNPTSRSFKIHTIEPVLTEKAKSILLAKIKPTEEVKRVDAGEEVEYSGNFHVNTSELTEAEIVEMMPLIEAYRVIFNHNEEIILPIRP